jgi:hypothetical protein
LISDTVFRIVEVEAGGFEREAFASTAVGGEQLAEMHCADRRVVRRERPPGQAAGQ